MVNQPRWHGNPDPPSPFGGPGFGPPHGGPEFGPPMHGGPGFGPPHGGPGFGPPMHGGPGFGPPHGGHGQGGHGGHGQHAQPPSSPPPFHTPSFPTHQTFAVDPGAIRGCLYRFTYVWLSRRNGFWFYPVFVGRRSVAGYRWNSRRRRWEYTGIDLNQIIRFTCS
ncbi:hypothetical protein AU377_11780 [Sporosarcina sp. HYO08]|nr:hypothetical protein [Sporosarcina sp. HYO08]KXH79330.1 hypothetical protein AU377_11780 [Sporosarcina sp. HYO08]